MMEKGVGKSAEAGIGTLILFVAFILVAAIAAAVLISTSGTLQDKALETGTRTQRQVSSGVMALAIYGENASATPGIDYIFATVRLTAGSDPVDLNTSFVEVFSGSLSATYNFNQSGDCSMDWLSNATLSSGQFAVEGKEGYNRIGVLQEGDVLLTCARLPSSIAESEFLSWQFSPKNGAFTRVKMQAPNVMESARVHLFP